MAMLNVQELVAQQLRANSGEARIETKLAIGAFATGVDKVSDAGVDKYLESTLVTTKAVKADEMTAESAQIIMSARKLLMDAKVGYAVEYFGTR